MSSFTKELILRYDQEENVWVTNREFSYHVGTEESEDVVTVPKGFSSDLASVPWPATLLIPKSGRFNQSAVLHDWLYNQRFIHGRSRKECDQIFLEAMGVLGVVAWKRYMMYYAVRSFGWIPWRKKNGKDS